MSIRVKMLSIFGKLSKLFKFSLKSRSPQNFKEKFQRFQNLLVANDRALENMAQLSESLNQKEPFAFGRGRRLIIAILENCRQIIGFLSSICPGRFQDLLIQYEDIYKKENLLLSISDIESEKTDEHISSKIENISYSIDFRDIDMGLISRVGGKMARLGEVKNVLNNPVPDGICLTSRCFEEFFTINNLRRKIDDLAGNLNINNSIEIQTASRAIQAMLVSAPIPSHLEEEILNAYDRLCKRVGKECSVAVRSSAVGEDDPVHSFAGLHYTALNVSRANLVDACWEVLISKYLPESMVYRFVTGLRDSDMPMNICCMVMLDPKVSGTLFTVDPQKKKPGMIIQTVKGVGSLVVEGKVSPQEYIIERNSDAKIIEFSQGSQNHLLIPRKGDGLKQVELDPDQIHEKFLTQKQIEFLVNYGLSIEAHFGSPQDIEWAITRDDRIFVLQTRPLQVVDLEKAQKNKNYSSDDIKSRNPVLIEGGDCASSGSGSGPVFIAGQERFLVNFPDGGVLIAKKSTPTFAQVLHKAAAVVTEIGSTTGHLSIIARELGVPTILNLKNATSILKNDQYITVDADNGLIFSGRVKELSLKNMIKPESTKPFHNTPIYKLIKSAANYILPLNLTDSQAENFTAKNCKTTHDITRFCHEMAILEMFNINDMFKAETGRVRELKLSIPIEIYVIDLGKGLKEKIESRKVKPEEIRSKPFQALIEGMITPGLPWSGPVPMDLKGFAGLIMNTMVDTGRSSREMGSRSYAMISNQYLNFSARLGYHFSNLDAYSSSSIHRNYISFRFKGGAADSSRRARRAKFISEVLISYGFHVVQRGDHVHSTIRKISEKDILIMVKNIGRLMGAIRNADVTMISDEQIQLYTKAFLSGSSSPVETVSRNQIKTKG